MSAASSSISASLIIGNIAAAGCTGAPSTRPSPPASYVRVGHGREVPYGRGLALPRQRIFEQLPARGILVTARDHAVLDREIDDILKPRPQPRSGFRRRLPHRPNDSQNCLPVDLIHRQVGDRLRDVTEDGRAPLGFVLQRLFARNLRNEKLLGDLAERRNGFRARGRPMSERVLTVEQHAAQLVALGARLVERDVAERSKPGLPALAAVAVD
jgi:hypothetical protein